MLQLTTCQLSTHTLWMYLEATLAMEWRTFKRGSSCYSSALHRITWAQACRELEIWSSLEIVKTSSTHLTYINNLQPSSRTSMQQDCHHNKRKKKLLKREFDVFVQRTSQTCLLLQPRMKTVLQEWCKWCSNRIRCSNSLCRKWTPLSVCKALRPSMELFPCLIIRCALKITPWATAASPRPLVRPNKLP